MNNRLKKRKIYSDLNFFKKLIFFFVWLYRDFKYILKHGRPFLEYGVTCYAGRQGYGKTVAMVEYLERMRQKYPECLIVTNFNYKHQNRAMIDWKDFYEIRNGRKGVIFAIDEIQNEYSSNAWKDFPETLLSEITQQRKQKVKIICSTQVYTRMVKQLRDQCFDVIECRTLAHRWTFLRAFDAYDYEAVMTMPAVKNKTKRLWRRNFIQDDVLRNLYDTEEKVKRLARTPYLPRSERGFNV